MVLRDARQLVADIDSLSVDTWASGVLGHAWLTAGISEREPEAKLCQEVARRALDRPSPEGLAALAALRRLAPESEHPALDTAIGTLSESQVRPSWIDAATLAAPLAAWRAVDVWDSNRTLFIEYADPRPHTLMASVLEASGSTVNTLRILRPGAAEDWSRREDLDVPMPAVPRSADEVLAELATALQRTDITIPREDDDDFVALRALAWSRCRANLPGWPTIEDLGDDERQRLVDEYLAESGLPDTDTTRSLADLFLDYGAGYITTGPLSWSPDRVGLFLADWVPRKATLDADERQQLPEALRRWVQFALRRRGVETRWIEPVVQAVDTHLPTFASAFDDESNWGPAKAIAAELVRRGVDLSDRAATEDAVRALNAETLARRLEEGR